MSAPVGWTWWVRSGQTYGALSIPVGASGPEPLPAPPVSCDEEPASHPPAAVRPRPAGPASDAAWRLLAARRADPQPRPGAGPRVPHAAESVPASDTRVTLGPSSETIPGTACP